MVWEGGSRKAPPYPDCIDYAGCVTSNVARRGKFRSNRWRRAILLKTTNDKRARSRYSERIVESVRRVLVDILRTR